MKKDYINDLFFLRYTEVIDGICNKYNYDNNLRHLLYLIVPIFIIKYGLSNEKNIIRCFEETSIIFDDTPSATMQAFFQRKLVKSEESYHTKKYIVIKKSLKGDYLFLLDSILHEFNHAINSINNELLIQGQNILLRTGLSYIEYVSNNFKFDIRKTKTYVLEEIINTKQTEEIIRLICEIETENIKNDEIKGLIMSIKRELIGNQYKSKAYKLEMDICEELMNNKTFLMTLEKSRITGDVEYIEEWFDNICGNKGSYKNINEELYEILMLEQKYGVVFFKKRIICKIKNKVNIVKQIIKSFNDGCVYK